jgi:hypothetical protein
MKTTNKTCNSSFAFRYLCITAVAGVFLQGCAELQQAAAQVTTAAANASRSVSLVTNGGFEKPIVPDGQYQLFNTGQSFPGWQVVGAPGNVSPISGKYRQAGINFTAQSGNQWLDMTGLSNSATGVEQTVRTQPGGQYTLTFSVGNVVTRNGGFGTTSAVEVLVNGNSVGTFRNDGESPGMQHWRQASVPVTATSATTTIAFINRDARNDNSCGLDSVSMVAR